jgi:hypothetical protein
MISFVDNALKQVCINHKEKGRQRVSLFDSTTTVEMSTRNPFKRIDDEPVSRILSIQPIQVSEKPRLFIISKIVLYSTLSNALVKSNFNMMSSLLECWH